MSHPKQLEVARIFSEDLSFALGDAKMQEIIVRNGQLQRACCTYCASHDFCDANQVMLAAMVKAGVGTDDEIMEAIGFEGRSLIRDCWNAAWEEAIRCKFWWPEAPEKIKITILKGTMFQGMRFYVDQDWTVSSAYAEQMLASGVAVWPSQEQKDTRALARAFEDIAKAALAINAILERDHYLNDHVPLFWPLPQSADEFAMECFHTQNHYDKLACQKRPEPKEPEADGTAAVVFGDGRVEEIGRFEPMEKEPTT